MIHYIQGDTTHKWPIVSQNPNVASQSVKSLAETEFLPELINAWHSIEQHMGYAWQSTSYWRKSPSHHKGIALDIAPLISRASYDKYAVHKGSDPVLYKRTILMRGLQAIATKFTTINPNYSIGVFVEPDHLHIQVFRRSELLQPMRIYKWKQTKSSYRDSPERIKLGMIN